MTPVNGDIDQILRSALHAEVDSIEPGDGLERIHRRTHAPWLVRQASLMLTECVDLARLIVIRLEPAFTGLRTAIAERGGPWAALVGMLSSMVASIVDLFKPPSRRPSHGHRGPRSGSNWGWLRPALAVAGAVVIVVAGVYGLAQVRDNLVLELFPSGTPASNGPGGSGGGQAPTLNGQSVPSGAVPSSGQSGSARPSPDASCSRAPKAQSTPTPSVSDSSTPTDTPTPVPTDTTVPTSPAPAPTDTASTSAVSLGSAGIHTVAKFAPASCRSASPSQSS